jgi:hypothetical protein
VTWHDGLDIAATLATVGAALLAWLTIRDSRKQARVSADDLVRERRIDFELTVLKELAELNSWVTNQNNRDTQIRVHLSLLPAKELPYLNRRFDIGQYASIGRAADDADALVRSSVTGIPVNVVHRQTGHAEIVAAINRRLAERSS